MSVSKKQLQSVPLLAEHFPLQSVLTLPVTEAEAVLGTQTHRSQLPECLLVGMTSVTAPSRQNRVSRFQHTTMMATSAEEDILTGRIECDWIGIESLSRFRTLEAPW